MIKVKFDICPSLVAKDQLNRIDIFPNHPDPVQSPAEFRQVVNSHAKAHKQKMAHVRALFDWKIL